MSEMSEVKRRPCPEQHLDSGLCPWCLLASRDERIKVLEEALRLVVKQTEEWNRSVEAIIGRQPKTGIDLEAVNRALRGEEAGE